MTSIRVELEKDPNKTYPTVTPRGIVEMTPAQQEQIREKAMSLEERVLRLEQLLGIKKGGV